MLRGGLRPVTVLRAQSKCDATESDGVSLLLGGLRGLRLLHFPPHPPHPPFLLLIKVRWELLCR